MNCMVKLAVMPLLLAPLWAQDRIVSTRIFTDIPALKFGLNVTVDGQAYTTPATLFWPEGSKHIITLPAFQLIEPGVAVSCTGWKDNLDAKLDGLSIAVTANRAITFYQGLCELTYKIDLQFNAGGLPFLCSPGPAYGKVYLGGTCYDHDAEVWASANSTMSVQAYPPEGYVFEGWTANITTSTAYEMSFLVNRPISLAPRFSPAVRMTIVTSPPDLQVLADRTPVPTPVTLDWASGSRHNLGPVSPQYDQWGKLWVFDSWAHGGGELQTYTVTGTPNSPQTITANYAPGGKVTLLTSPGGLKLNVDGRTWPSYSFAWKIGSTHTVEAPLEQVDGRGRRHVFMTWSNTAGATQDVTVTDSDMRLTATYDMLAKLVVRSAAAGLSVMVDGNNCPLPCTVEPRQWAEVKLAAPASVPLNESTRLDFDSWSDGAPRERTWKGGGDEQALLLNYRTSHKVQVTAEPGDGAVIRLEPASPDGYYPEGTEVRVTVEPKPGYRFRRWEGDLSGKWNAGVLKAGGPRWARALLEKEPYIPPAGVRNAAAELPEAGVAAGSLIAIYGANLAAEYQAAPGSPLPQTIGNVTVRVGDRLLPLLMVSPEQITAQLFSDLAEGEYTVVVRPEGQAEVSAPFTVVRNAPGLFTRTLEPADDGGEVKAAEGRLVALATHADGALVSPESPAQPGETVTLLGTGFGPYERAALDGFAAAETPKLALVDQVEIVIGDRVIPAVSAVAAPGYVGVTAVRFKVPDDAAAGLELAAKVNGRESNKVNLPVK